MSSDVSFSIHVTICSVHVCASKFLLQIPSRDRPTSDALGCRETMGYAKGEAEREIVKALSGWIPKFTDVFDEESFYLFALLLVVFSVIATCFCARFVKVRDSGHLD